MEGGGTRLERKTDVSCLGQRKGEVVAKKMRKEKGRITLKGRLGKKITEKGG